jgi:hypothetical protein
VIDGDGIHLRVDDGNRTFDRNFKDSRLCRHTDAAQEQCCNNREEICLFHNHSLTMMVVLCIASGDNKNGF